MSSILNNDHFDCISDDLFSDSDNELNITKLENNIYTSPLDCEPGDFNALRYEEKKRLFELYMADPSIPASKKKGKDFLLSLYEPSYSTQKFYDLSQKHIPVFTNPKKIELPKRKKRRTAVEDFGYDPTFFAPTEVLMAERRKLNDIPKPIKEIYKENGIVAASQIYKIEQDLNCDDGNDSEKEINNKNKEVPSTSVIQKEDEKKTYAEDLNKSLLDLTRTVSDQYEISQIRKDLQNINDLDVSLDELTEKIQYSTKAAQLINHTITSSQRLKILENIYTADMNINTCDIFSDEELIKNSQELLMDNLVNSPVKKSDINDNIFHVDADKNYNEPIEVKFTFALDKKVSMDNGAIFETEDGKMQIVENLTSPQKLSQSRAEPINILKENKSNSPKSNIGFVFASGKSANISFSKFVSFEKKFNDEEEKLKNEACNKNKENEIFYEDSPIKTARKQIKDSEKESLSYNKRVYSKSIFARKPKKVKFDESSIINDSKNHGNVQQVANFENEPMKNLENELISLPKSGQCGGFVFASGRSASINGSKLLNIEKKFMEEEEKLKKMELESSVSKVPSMVNEELKVIDNLVDLPEHNGLNLIRTKSVEDDEISMAFKLSRQKLRSALERRPKELKNNENASDNGNDTKTNAGSSQINLIEFNSTKENPQNQKNTEESILGCAFVFASGKNVNINQSKLSSFKRKFEDVENEDKNRSSTLCKVPVHLSKNPQASKINTSNVYDSDEEMPLSSNQSSSKLVVDSGLSFHSHRMRSLRSSNKMGDNEIFNFSDVCQSSTYTLRNKKSSQSLTAASSTVKKIGDSGIESQDRLINKVESPQPFLNKMSAFFAPLFTSSPIVARPSSGFKRNKLLFEKSETKNLHVIPISSFKRRLKDDIKFFDDDDDDMIPFKPIPVKRLALENETMISPIVDKKRPRMNDFVSKNLTQTKSIKYDKPTLSQRLAEFDEFMTLESQKVLFAHDPTESQFNSILETEQHHLSKIDAENKVKNERQEAIKEQIEYVNHKPSEDSRQMTGTMYMMKSGSKRLNLYEYLKKDRPRLKNIHLVVCDELLDFKFDMKDFFNDPNSKISIIVGDNAKIIMDESSKIGYNEISNGFLASPGVDPKLIKLNWIENAYKMILMKFLWMENYFDKIDKFEVLTPENVLLQLKYRYDREIDRHQRPAIRKITEMDEVPSRRIVLKVINVYYSLDIGYELELTDGWYKIRACVDSCLAEAIAKKKIVTNTKLIICNSELINLFSTGYHPLEIPASVRLKIHGNSTRIMSWHKKLGFCKNPHPFLISLNSVSSDGGVIGRMKLFIIHVYSIVYVESNGEKKEFRSEKMQHRIENKKEIMYSTIYEKMQKQVMDETYSELKQRIQKIDRKKIVLSKMPIQDICDILEYENESDLTYAIKSQLTINQMEKIREAFNQRKFELNQKIKERINKNENSVAQLLKFRVVDATNPKKTALISWWQPSDELMDIVKQGNVIEIFKTSSVGKFQAMCGGEIQVHADKSTIVKLLKTNGDIGKFSHFIRRETKFEDITRDFSPLNNEFDISCMIIHIEETQNDGKLQKVYAADEKMNLISVCFYPSLSEYAYDDVLIEGKILYIRNLQWRKVFKFDIVQLPEAHAVIDSTIFISNPRDEIQRNRLEEISSKIGDIIAYTQKCREKLETFIGKIAVKSKNKQGVCINFEAPIPTQFRPKKRFLGMKRLPHKYRFS